MTQPISLGTGRLTWNKSERISDRYGAVYLMSDEARSNSLSTTAVPSVVNDAAARPLVGVFGKLFCRVITTRKSTHIGDLFRGIFPETPEKGAEITLGSGLLFVEPAYDSGICVGLIPTDGPRSTDWLDPRALYNVHEQTVELLFQPEEKQSERIGRDR